MIDKLSWISVYPEVILSVMACVIALADLGVKTRLRTLTYVLTLLTLGVVAVLQATYASGGATVYGFGNMVVSDPMGNWLKCFATVAVMITLVYGRPYAADRDMLRGGELFSLSMFALLGMFVMISGNNFLVIYLGLELLTLSSYALVALRRDNEMASEAAMKYFVLGAMASGFSVRSTPCRRAGCMATPSRTRALRRLLRTTSPSSCRCSRRARTCWAAFRAAA